MKTIVEICACSKCVLNGSLQLVESVESLQGLRETLGLTKEIVVSTPMLCDKHTQLQNYPTVTVDGVVVKNPKSETIMSMIITAAQ